jgi:hypothetical protein
MDAFGRSSQARWSRIGLDWTTAFHSCCGSHKPQIVSRAGLGGTAESVIFVKLPSFRPKSTTPLHRRAIDAAGASKLLHAALRISGGTNSLNAREILPHYLEPLCHSGIQIRHFTPFELDHHSTSMEKAGASSPSCPPS